MADGILLVDKPEGPTSAEVVRAIKRRFRVASVGHLGTLDPMATGLLPLCLGQGTKIAQFLAAERKTYVGEIRLGVATDTLDVTGRIVAEASVPELDRPKLAQIARSLLGPGTQRPPMYSAVKVAGQELYKLARAGLEVDRQARPIEIFSLELEAVPGDPGLLRFAVDCSKGTYVRVLAADIGRELGTEAALATLRRTAFGAFRIEEARPLDALLEVDGADALPMLDPRSALRGVREIPLGAELAYAIAVGQQAAIRSLEPPRADERLAALVAPGGHLLAVIESSGGCWALRRVLMPEASQLYRPRADC